MAADSSRTDPAKLEDVYLLAFSRVPNAEETQSALQYLNRRMESARDDKDKLARRKEAYEDILWALMSSKEFLFNH